MGQAIALDYRPREPYSDDMWPTEHIVADEQSLKTDALNKWTFVGVRRIGENVYPCYASQARLNVGGWPK